MHIILFWSFKYLGLIISLRLLVDFGPVLLCIVQNERPLNVENIGHFKVNTSNDPLKFGNSRHVAQDSGWYFVYCLYVARV